MTTTIIPDQLARLCGVRKTTPVMLAVAAPLQDRMAEAGMLSSRLQLCHAMAQWAHETDRFRTLVEYGDAAYFSRYEGRRTLGNTEPGDGARFRGRGITQLTGRANYGEATRQTGIDLVGTPDLAADPEVAALLAVNYWVRCKIGVQAEADSLTNVTKLINGGLNGIEDRRALLVKAKTIWPAPSQSTTDLQHALNRLGTSPKLRPDGVIGPMTTEAVRKFQVACGLVTDGKAGPKTWAAIDAALAKCPDAD